MAEPLTVPLYTKDPSEGIIEYPAHPDHLNSFDGFFSFTFYMRDSFAGVEKTTKQSNLYLHGLALYTTFLQAKPFTNWAILVYTDEYTVNEMETILKRDPSKVHAMERREFIQVQKLLNALRSNVRVFFVKVTWPKHQRRLALPQVNGPILRPFRSRAPFDFPTKYVFIRDADTLFEDKLRSTFEPLPYMSQEEFLAQKDIFAGELFLWEARMLSLMPTIQEYLHGNPPLVVGTGSNERGSPSTIYKKRWHSNEVLGKNAPFGIFAGFVNVAPGVPLYRSKDAWDEFVEFVNGRSIRIMNSPSSALENNYKEAKGIMDKLLPIPKANLTSYANRELSAQRKKYLEENILYRFSNNMKDQKIGRDEQLYLFLLMPKAIDNLFIFKQSLFDNSLPKLDLDYHERLMGIYTEALATNFKPTKGGRASRRLARKSQKTMRKRK